jgi:glycogen operon protein
MYLAGMAAAEHDERGRPVSDSDFLVMLNSSAEDVEFRVPAGHADTHWELVMDTGREPPFPRRAGEHLGVPAYPLGARSVAVFERLPRGA